MKKASLLIVFLSAAVLLFGGSIRSAGPAAADPGITPGVPAAGLAAAMDAPAADIASASIGTSDPLGEGVGDSALAGFPTLGPTFAILSTGFAASADDPDANNGETVGGGGTFDDVSAMLGGLNNSQGNDLVQLTLQLNVPVSVNCLTFDFAFFSEEWPDFFGSNFNDTFIAEIGAPGAASTFSIVGNDVTAPNNFAFDPLGEVLDVNSGFGFNPGDPNPDTGTTYDGGSGLLRASTPVTPGATVEVVFSIMDLGDSLLDSAVFLDAFQWGALTELECQPGAHAVCDESPISPSTVEAVIFPGQSLEIEKCVEAPQVPPRPDIYFLADTTGSMGDALAAVQADAASVLATIDGATPDARYGAGDYKDFQSPVQLDPYAFNNSASIPGADDNGAAALAAIAGWSAAGGNDGPEGQLYALAQLADPSNPVSFRSDSSKIVVWFGDAPAHDPVCSAISGLGSDLTEASVTAALVAANIKVIAISVVTAQGVFYPDALDDDPTSLGGDYLAACGVENGLSGQATRIAAATGGVHLTGVDPVDIAASILQAIGDVSVEVEMVSTCVDPISTTFDPASKTVISGSVATFTETISVASDAPGGTYLCVDRVLIDGELMLDDAGNPVQEVKVIRVPEGFLTGGGQITNGKGKNLTDQISFGGNVGFMADGSFVGQWQTNFHNVHDTDLHGASFHSTEILGLQFVNDGGAGPNPPPANANVGVFLAEGRVAGVDGFQLLVCLADRGEPGQKNDSIRLQLFAPGGGLIYDSFSDFASEDNTVGGPCADRHKLDAGNFQIHSGVKE